jgi:hypothetical protein
MKSITSSPQKFMRVLLYFVVLSVVVTFSNLPQQAQRVAGDLWLTGAVTMNGTSVTSGVTVFNNSQVKTARASFATVNLGKLGRIKLEPESELILQFTNGLIGGNQLAGLTAISANKGIKAKITTPHVLVEADGSQVGLVSIDVKPAYTCVVVNRGNVRLTAGQKVSYLSQGQALSFDARGPEKESHCEGLRASQIAKPLATVGAVTAAALIPLTRDAVASVRGVTVTPATTAGEVTNQSSPPPTSTATNNPTTPIKPGAAFNVCNCKYDKDGRPLSTTQRVDICQVSPAGDRTTAVVSCANLLLYFNLNGTPRAGFEQYSCGICRTTFRRGSGVRSENQ